MKMKKERVQGYVSTSLKETIKKFSAKNNMMESELVTEALNQNEIRNHRKNNGRTPNLQAHVNKMHLNYIAMRPGAALNNNAHGVFGYI